MVELIKINEENWLDYVGLSVREDQKGISQVTLELLREDMHTGTLAQRFLELLTVVSL